MTAENTTCYFSVILAFTQISEITKSLGPYYHATRLRKSSGITSINAKIMVAKLIFYMGS
jgi:hypothetical protein